MFDWETLREIGPDTYRFESGDVPGKVYEVKLTHGQAIQVWRADDGQQYFCHGLTFGGKEAPGGAVSPYGDEVPTILGDYYGPVGEAEARPGDILVWRGLDANDVLHSAILTDPVVLQGQTYLDYSSRLQSKNRICDPEANLTLEQIIVVYGESYNVFRRK